MTQDALTGVGMAGSKPRTASERIVRALNRTPVHIALGLVALVWLAPTIGLLITSFRPRGDIQSSGWWEIFGTMRFTDVLEPAEDLARDGFGLTEREHGDWKPWVEDLKQDPETARTWLVDGQVPPLSGRVRSPTRSCARSATAAGR